MDLNRSYCLTDLRVIWDAVRFSRHRSASAHLSAENFSAICGSGLENIIYIYCIVSCCEYAGQYNVDPKIYTVLTPSFIQFRPLHLGDHAVQTCLGSQSMQPNSHDLCSGSLLEQSMPYKGAVGASAQENSFEPGQPLQGGFPDLYKLKLNRCLYFQINF